MDDGHAGLNYSAVTDARREDAERTASHSHPDTYSGVSPIKVRKLGHLVYEVSDVPRSVKFWTEVMGFQVSEGNSKGMVFLRHGTDHHSIGLKPSKHERRADASAGLRIEHLAFEVANNDELLKARAYLIANNIPIVFEGRKGPGCNEAINFLDPDGHEFELYCNMDQIDHTGRLRPSSHFRPALTLDEAIANPVPETW